LVVSNRGAIYSRQTFSSPHARKRSKENVFEWHENEKKACEMESHTDLVLRDGAALGDVDAIQKLTDILVLG